MNWTETWNYWKRKKCVVCQYSEWILKNIGDKSEGILNTFNEIIKSKKNLKDDKGIVLHKGKPKYKWDDYRDYHHKVVTYINYLLEF